MNRGGLGMRLELFRNLLLRERGGLKDSSGDLNLWYRLVGSLDFLGLMGRGLFGLGGG